MNGQEEERVQVLVAGAGPAGLAVALELAGRGLAPLILERRLVTGSHPRATALSAETMQLISGWGAEPEVRRLGFRCEHVMSIRSCLTGPEIQRVPFPDHVWACAQDYLETILAKRAATAGAQLRYGAELTGLHPADGEMLATVAAPPGPLTTIRHGMSSAPTAPAARCARRPGSPPPGPAPSATESASCSARRCATTPATRHAWSTASATHPPAA